MLFTPFIIRDVTLLNRIVMSPMCQYSCDDGYEADWSKQYLRAKT